MTTLTEIAKRCGVSVMTVSNVLNGKTARVGPSTQEAVQRVIDELGYRPNALAVGLKRGYMNTIGVVSPLGLKRSMGAAAGDRTTIILRDWQASLVDGMSDAADELGQNLLWYSRGIWNELPGASAPLLDHRCDGLLLINVEAGHSIVADIKRAHVPFVVVSDTSDDPLVSYVDIDNVDAGRAITDHLIALGHRKIAFLGQDDSYRWCADRITGYRGALLTAGIGYERTILVQPGYAGPLRMDEPIDLLLSGSETCPTAIVCASDSVAVVLMDACRAVGIRVPRDVSITGMNDGPVAEMCEPGLTTIHQPVQRIGYRVMTMLRDIISGRLPQGHHEIVPTFLVKRASATAIIR